MIHTTADFDYIKTVRIHPQAIRKGIEAIQRGRPLFTDTHMARVGIRKGELKRFGLDVTCLISEPSVKKTALQRGITRAAAAVDAAREDLEGGIYAVGNAPTALFRLIDLVREDRARPALIIGLPVGFVHAAEAKEALMALDYPHISNQGRKGGSNLAASVINALLKMAAERESHGV